MSRRRRSSAAAAQETAPPLTSDVGRSGTGNQDALEAARAAEPEGPAQEPMILDVIEGGAGEAGPEEAAPEETGELASAPGEAGLAAPPGGPEEGESTDTGASEEAEGGGGGAVAQGGEGGESAEAEGGATGVGDVEPVVNEAPEVTPDVSTGGPISVDDYLDTHASDVTCQTLQTQERDWIDVVNDVRGHPMGELVINVGERMIPFYGAYDAVRDGWNGFAEQWEMVGDDPVMKTILVLELVVGLFGDLISHLAYLAKCVGYVAYLLEGAGAIVNALVSAADVVAAICDGINFVLGVVGSCWASYKAGKATDPQEKARYQWLTFKQSEHMITSLVSGVVGLITIGLTAGQAPGAAGREVGRNLGKQFAEGLATGAPKAGFKWLFGFAAPTTSPTPVNPMPRLPKDIFGDVAAVGYLFTDPGTPAREKLDRFVKGTQRPNGGPVTTTTCDVQGTLQDAHTEAAAQSLPTSSVSPPEQVDHSPAQVEALAQTEANVEAALATADENVASSEQGVTNAAAVEQQYSAAAEVASGMTGQATSAQTDLQASLPVASQLTSGLTELMGGFGQLSGPAGRMSGAAGQAGNAAAQRPRKKEDRSLLDRAKDWLVDRAMSTILSAAGPAEASAGAAGGRSGEASSQTGQGQGFAQGLLAEEQASMAETQAAAGEASAGVTAAQERETQLQGEVVAAQEWGAQAEAERVQHEGERDQLVTLLAEVQAERARQEAANAAFAATWGPWFEEQAAQDGQSLPPVSDIHVGGLWSAHDDVAALGDGLIGEGQSLLAQVPPAMQGAAREALDRFQLAHAGRMSTLAAAIAGVPVGDGAQAAWDALTRAEQLAVNAEAEILASWSEVAGVLTALATLELDEERSAAPELATEDL